MWLVLLPTLILSLWAAGWVISATRDFTPEIHGDSAVYLSTAQGWRRHALPTVAFNLDQDGLSPKQAVAFHGRVPSTVFPPGYPLVLAVISAMTGTVRSAARVVDVVLIVVNLLLIAWLTARMTAKRSLVLATLPAVLLLFDSDIRRIFFVQFGWLQLHRSVSSEPLFMAVSMVGLLALHGALRATAHARRALVVASFASGAALLVRYVNVAFMFATVIALVAFDRRRALRSRLRRAGFFAAVASTPAALFVVWARLDGGRNPTSTIAEQSAGLLAPLDRLADYLLPWGGPHAARILVIVVTSALLVIGAIWSPALPGTSPDEDGDSRLLVQLVLLYIVAYLCFVIVTVTFFDLSVPIDARILAPVRGLWYAALLAVAYRSLVRVLTSVGAVAIVSALAALLVISNWAHTRSFLDEAPAQSPRPTAVTTAIAHLPRDALIISNAPDAIYDLTERGSIALPVKKPEGAPAGYGSPANEYEYRIGQLVELFNTRGGYLALLSPSFNRVTMPPELQRSLDLRLVTQSPKPGRSQQLYEIPAGSSRRRA